jgi:uncharacterized protein (TIGR02246 family)
MKQMTAVPPKTARPHAPRHDSTAEAKTAIRALKERWIEAVRTGHAELLASLVTPDYEVWANGAPPFVGPDAVASAMGAAVAHYVVEPSFETQELIVAGDWAFERGIERLTITPRNGGAHESRAQRALLIYRRGADGEWRYARGMTNALPGL